MSTIISIQNLTKSFKTGGNTIHALDNISLEIEKGEFVVVLGPSGSGKTTLLNMVSALDTATSGHIFIDGQDITKVSRQAHFAFRRQTVSFIFQTFNLFPALTAYENVLFGADVRGRHNGNGKAIAEQMLTAVGLGQRLHHFPHELSGGEQQRVAIARALATQNPIMLADEPTGELDFQTGIQILQLLQDQAKQGITTLVVTHNREISRIADRVIELSSGHIVRDGSPQGGKAPISELSW